MNKKYNIEKLLSKISFDEISKEEKERVWAQIAAKSTRQTLFPFNKKYMITSFIIACALALGIGGTVVTADNANPGDKLFKVDRAVENIRLTLSSEEKKNELRVKFAEERVQELRQLKASGNVIAVADITDSSVSEIEADAFTNETIVKIELKDGRKAYFTTEAKTKESVVTAINAKYSGLSKTFVEGLINFDIEDRSSKPEDKNSDGSTVDHGSNDQSSKQKARIALGISAALSLLQHVSASVEEEDSVRLKAITDELNEYLKTLPEANIEDLERFKIRVNSKGDRDEYRAKIDLRTEDGRIRLDLDNDDDDEDEDEDDDDKEKNWKESYNRRFGATITSVDVDAIIFNNETVVKLEFNGKKKSTFTTEADTRDEIISDILAKYPMVTRAQVESNLTIETEDRDSRFKDISGFDYPDDDDGPWVPNEDDMKKFEDSLKKRDNDNEDSDRNKSDNSGRDEDDD